MKKILAIAVVLMVCLMGLCAVAEEDHLVIHGDIVDGSYVLSFDPVDGDAGTWEAVEPSQDNALVRLADAHEEDGKYMVRFEPVEGADGEVTVRVRHMLGQVCDQYHDFTLSVKDGAVVECIGGAQGMSTPEDDLNEVLSGEWWEKDTQFTVMDVDRALDGGWNMVIYSPVSHGAYMVEAKLFYDCEQDALVYHDGTLYDMPVGDESAAGPVEREKGIAGSIRFAGTEEQPELVWTAGNDEDSQQTVFTRADALPEYEYTGEDPYVKAVVDHMISSGMADMFASENGSVFIPEPVILKVENVDDSHARVYGNLWASVYVRRTSVLRCISGGEMPAVAELELKDGAWKVTSMETAGDGEDYAADIRKFCNGDSELEDAFFTAADGGSDVVKQARLSTLRAYVEQNGLVITAYQDPGWDPVEIGE